MGIFSSIFSGIISGVASNTSFLGNYRESSGKSYSGGGWGHARFCSIIDAHSSTEDIVYTWELNGETCPYMSVDGYANPYTQAYQEAYQEAVMEAEIISILGEEINPEDLIDWDEVEDNAYEYACDLVYAWYDGEEWIPEEIMDWAWYELSNHNY